MCEWVKMLRTTARALSPGTRERWMNVSSVYININISMCVIQPTGCKNKDPRYPYLSLMSEKVQFWGLKYENQRFLLIFYSRGDILLTNYLQHVDYTALVFNFFSQTDAIVLWHNYTKGREVWVLLLHKQLVCIWKNKNIAIYISMGKKIRIW